MCCLCVQNYSKCGRIWMTFTGPRYYWSLWALDFRTPYPLELTVWRRSTEFCTISQLWEEMVLRSRPRAPGSLYYDCFVSVHSNEWPPSYSLCLSVCLPACLPVSLSLSLSLSRNNNNNNNYKYYTLLKWPQCMEKSMSKWTLSLSGSKSDPL